MNPLLDPPAKPCDVCQRPSCEGTHALASTIPVIVSSSWLVEDGAVCPLIEGHCLSGRLSGRAKQRVKIRERIATSGTTRASSLRETKQILRAKIAAKTKKT